MPDGDEIDDTRVTNRLPAIPADPGEIASMDTKMRIPFGDRVPS
jgi:hypothetical protein